MTLRNRALKLRDLRSGQRRYQTNFQAPCFAKFRFVGAVIVLVFGMDVVAIG